ncbi:MAG: right-handed parallel beta-helix repeat-containing protein [Phaeodactylibacter sp.]|nr:right-handed parallel beta-helix repeat-containing protein [Phaeodactylibacter sp.]MCB9049168.1 right-handed parallel beta-helix repeat-containing protein [Lewinellaceae bacterium]
MKSKHLLPVCVLLSISLKAQPLYVNGNATGIESGHSWQNAFTSLKDALAAAPEGVEIWVAAGTYTPAATFYIGKNLKLLAGFAGHETDPEARNPDANVVVLSGDLNGDDIPGDFETNRSDNVMNVVTIAAGVTQDALLEGFVIRGGHAYGPASPQKGGAIFCLGNPTIRKCVFEFNLARESGGALYLDAAGDKGVALEDCRFFNNRANDGGALYSTNSKLSVKQCTFTRNTAGAGPHQKNGGALYSIDSYGLIQDCSFTENFAFDFGGALFVRTVSAFGKVLEFQSCTFESNEALTDQGGGVFIYNSGDGHSFLFSGCRFLGNQAGTWGGGFDFEARPDGSNSRLVLENCLFHQNSNEIYGDGSAMFLRLAGPDVDVQVSHSNFSENTTDYYATAAIWATGGSGASGNVAVSDCTFQNNAAKHSAGLDLGSSPGIGPFHFRVSDCSFRSNRATGRSGGLTLYSESPATCEVERCRFENNRADGQGGALWLAVSEPGFQARIRECIFKGNQSTLGGAVMAYPLFFPSTQEADITFENNLFVNNVSDNAVIAGKYTGKIRLSNSTIAHNQSGSLLAGSESGFELQNTILYNPGFTEFESLSEDNTASITSLGGNLIGDNSMKGLLHATDHPATNPLLDAGHRLIENSPAIDAGLIFEGMPSHDLDGNDRMLGGCIDSGAFESIYHSGNECQLVGAWEHAARAMPLQLFPNPAVRVLKVQLPVSVSSPFFVSLFDSAGNWVGEQQLAEGELLNVEGLPGGIYWVQAVMKEKSYTGKLIKR